MHKWKMKVLSAMLAVSMIVSLTGTPAYAAGVPALEEEGMESISGESVSDGEENVDEEMQSGNAEISHQNQTEETAAVSDGNSVGNELQEPLSSDNEVQEAESVSRTEVEPYQDSESKDKVWTTNSDYVEYIQLGGMSNNQCTDNGAEAYWNQDKQRYEVILLDSQQISTRTFILGDRDNSKDGVQWCLFKENGRRYASNLSTRVNSEKAVNHLLGQLQLSKIIAGKEFVGDDVNLLIVQNVKNTLNGVPEEDILENKIKMHFSLRTSLAKADGLKVVKADGTAESVEKYQSYIFGYNVGVEDDQETVTLECKPETPLSTENTVGTVLEYFDKDGNKITPTAEKLTSDNKGKQVTFSLKDLEVNEEGDPYVQIRVSYNGGGEVKASTYTVQFKLPERQWQVEADSDQEVTCNKGDTPRLAVKLSGSPTGRVQYQWYDTLKDYRGAMIPGANEVTYVPSTVYSGTAQYYCKVTETLESGVQVSMYSPIFTVKVRATYASEPQITQQPEDMEVFIGKEAYLSVRAKNVDDGTQTQLSIQWYLVGENGAEDIPVGKEYMGLFSRQLVNTSKSGSYKYYALVTNTVKDALDIEPATIKSNVVTVTVKAIPGTEDLEGTGDEEDPYLVKNIEDLKKLKKIVEGGNTLEGRYIKLAADLTLPADWDPIGCYQEGHDENVPGSDFNGKYINPFSGNFDGGGHKVTIEDGGQAIFKYVRKASIRNMEIYGRDIKGSAVVSGMFTDYGTTGLYDMYESPWTVKIENVTLLTGSKTSDSGFLPGSGSGVNSVWITNCEIQEGVTVGNPEEASPYVGGFIGFMNGYITNSVCRATVYGGGGLAAMKGQTMGACRINNSAFIGTLVSAGRAGGIIGSGYGYRSEYHKWDLSAPNTPVVTIQNCYVRADITGSIMVGGIIGGEPSCVECWGNGEGKIANCSFQGTLTATSPQTDVGGIVGFLNGFDKYQGIENCYYNNNCGAEKGIGYIEQIILKEDNERYGLDEVPDFSKLCIATKPENFLNGKVVEALNAPNNSFKNWVQGKEGPEHSDAAVPVGLSVSGSYIQEYLVGSELNLDGAVFTATMSDGSTKPVELKDIKISGYDKDVQGVQTVTLAYGPAECQITVRVLLPEGTITINFTLLGDSKHDSGKDGKIHTLTDGNLEEWVKEVNYQISNNDTVWAVLKKILAANNMTCDNPSENYVKSITRNGVAIGEFTNGDNSGWMFTVNGVHGKLGVNEQYLKQGDTVVFHYTDDYTKERTSQTYTAKEVIAMIDALPAVKDLTLADEADVVKARDAFNSLSAAEKAKVPAEKQEKLNAAVLRIAELKKAKADSPEDVYKTVGDYLAGLLKGNEAFWIEWPIIGLARAGRSSEFDQNAYYASVAATLKKNGSAKLSSTKSTENSRTILALTAIGRDVTDVAGYNLLEPLSDLDYLKKQGINGPIWALIAFDSHGYGIPAVAGGGTQVTRENLIQTILDTRLSDGGWALSGKASDPDMTAMAIQALAPYYSSNNTVKAAVGGALNCLSDMQSADGGFSSWGTTNSESCAQVIVALAALKINPATDSRFVKNGNSVLDALIGFRVKGSGFKHVANGEVNGMATEQGYYALAAYFRFLAGFTSLYDMSDVQIQKNGAKEYHILKGTDGLWTVNSDGSVTITADGDLADFLYLKIDGKVVDPSNYILKAGSTIVTLKAGFLKTLGKGGHTVTFVYKDGEVSMVLPLGEGGTPVKVNGVKTGDENNLAVYLTLMLCSAACMGALFLRKRRMGTAVK